MNTVYVGNISFKTMEEHLEALFSQCGVVQEVAIIKDGRTGRSKGYGFVSFSDKTAVEAALAQNGQILEGRMLKVNLANPPKQRSVHIKEEAPSDPK